MKKINYSCLKLLISASLLTAVAALPSTSLSANSCTVALADNDQAPNRLLELAQKFEEVLADTSRNREAEVSEILKGAISLSTSEVQHILNSKANVLLGRLDDSTVASRAEVNLTSLLSAVKKATKITSSGNTLVKSILSHTIGTPEQRLRPVEAEIQVRHYEALRDIEELKSESAELEDFIRQVEQRKPSLVEDLELLSNMKEVLRNDRQGRDHDPKVYAAADFAVEHEMALLRDFNSLVGGALEAWTQRLRLNQALIANAEKQIQTQLTALKTDTSIPLNLNPKSKVNQLCEQIEKMPKHDRAMVVSEARISSLTYADLFHLLSLLPTEEQLGIFHSLKPFFRDSISAYPLDKFVSLLTNVDFRVIADIMKESNGIFSIADVIKLQGYFKLGPEVTLTAVPAHLRLSQIDVVRELEDSRDLNFNQASTFLALVVDFKPSYEASLEYAAKIKSRISTYPDRAEFQTRFDRSLEDRGFGFDREISALSMRNSIANEADMRQLLGLIGKHEGTITAEQAIKVLELIPKQSVYPSGFSAIKNYDDLAVDLRRYLKSKKVSQAMFGFTSSDLKQMKMNLNLLAAYRSLRHLSNVASPELSARLKDQLFKIIGGAGLQEVPNNQNLARFFLPPPTARGTTLQHLTGFFQDSVERWSTKPSKSKKN